MKERVEKIESISMLFNVLAWLSLITCVLTLIISLCDDMNNIIIPICSLGSYISCLCMQYFFYALYVIAKGSVKYLNDNSN